MRFLHTTQLRIEPLKGNFEDFEYAVLSHRWTDDEITFQQFNTLHKSRSLGRGMAKILDCCELAAEQGYEWVWIDTCCIDRTDSTELSEAINSMWRLYRHSAVCFAYLRDMPRIYRRGVRPLYDDEYRAVKASQYWTRGWTLQELIAPAEVTFLDCRWVPFGNKATLAVELSEITGIRERILSRRESYQDASVAM
jgi:hypothetical protein